MKSFYKTECLSSISFWRNCLDRLPHRKILCNTFLVGTLGYAFPFSRDLFISITGPFLLLTCIFLSLFHRQEKTYANITSLCVFMGILLTGYVLEVIGVTTGLLFGSYTYGKALGIGFYNVPFMIGFNWAMLTYLFSDLLQRFTQNKIVRVLFGALGMLIYDILLEQLAPKLSFWFWQNESIPIRNYIDWFLIALCFNVLVGLFVPPYKNKIAPLVLLCQVLMFTFLLFVL